MPAYDRGNSSVEAYLVRILAALVRQNGGELRVKGELIDGGLDATYLLKEWDNTKGELVLRAGMHQFSEVFRVNPEKHVAQMPDKVADPVAKVYAADPFLPKRTTIDDERIAELERKKQVARAGAVIREELRRRKEQGNGGIDSWVERGA